MARVRLLGHSAYSAIVLNPDKPDDPKTTIQRGGDWVTVDENQAARLVADHGPTLEVDGAKKAVSVGLEAGGFTAPTAETGAPVKPDLTKLDG